MIFYQGQKYACLRCIRGHRSTSCDHRDRPLLRVRKRGRPNGDKSVRLAILAQDPCVCIQEGRECKCPGHNNCVVVRTISSDGIKAEDAPPAEPRQTSNPDEEECFLVGKYVFVSVGNGLYRKELAPSYLANEQSSTSCCSPYGPEATPPAPSSCCSSTFQSNFATSVGHNSTNITRQSANDTTGYEFKDDGSSRDTTPGSSDPTYHHAPSVLAPMGFSGHTIDDLGLTQQEAQDIWVNPSELDFATMCVVPGQCECGEGCACDNCATHSKKGHQTHL